MTEANTRAQLEWLVQRALDQVERGRDVTVPARSGATTADLAAAVTRLADERGLQVTIHFELHGVVVCRRDAYPPLIDRG